MTDEDQIQEMARLLRAGLTPAEIQRLLLPESSRRALRAIAVADLVTPDLFESVLRRHVQLDTAELTDLASKGLLETVPGQVPTWRVPPADTAVWMREWSAGQSTTGPAPELIALEADLAHWYEARGDDTEQLRHLLVADPHQAVRLFRAKFDAADECRDFARCQDLLDVLADPNRITLAGPEVSDLRLDRTGYLHARQFWSADYARSGQFLMPPGLAERANRLLSGDGPRIWQLHAPGGMGKTVQLRWLVARHCVTASVDVACARIDFDVIDPVNVARYPWLLLLEVADQLDRRFPRRVFGRLDRFSSYRVLAWRTTSELTREAAHGLAEQDEEFLKQAVSEIFTRRLNKAAGAHPVVVIVDTLEEVMLGGIDMGPLLRLLADLMRDCPELRLVLAGRYDLRAQAEQAMAGLGPVESVELTDFTPSQVRAYLAEVRGIPDEALHEVVLDRTGGQPFLVALFADFIEDHPEIAPAQLQRYREPLVQLLIERVIQRIPDPNVQWLVRYGVVPRRLRFEDVQTIIGPMLARGRSGQRDLDDPRTDDLDVPGHDQLFPIGQPPRDEAELAKVWVGLISYAARTSWVSPAYDGQSIVFHPNVRAPMRELISRQPVFRELHEAFRRRFELLAGEDPANRTGYLREVVYHRVQLGDPGAVDYWRTQVIQCRDRGDLDGMQELAGELLGTDYTDDGLPQRGPGGELLLPYGALADAHVFVAYVAVERARAVQAGPSDPLWAEARRELSHADMLRTRATQPTPVPDLEIALRAALLVAEAKPTEAASLAHAALPDAPDSSRVDLLRVIGDAYTALSDPAAEATYRAALELASAQGRADQQDAITSSLALQEETQGRLDRAIKWIRRVTRPTAAAMAGAMRAVRVWQARLLIECYQPAAALRSLDDEHPPDLPSVVEMALLRAQAYQLLGRVGHALSQLTAAAQATELTPASGRYAQLAQIHQLRGVVLGELLAVDEAEDSFQLAIGLWGEIGFAEGHPECSYQYRHFLIRDVGDLTAASRVIRPALAADSDLALRWDEDTAELRAAQYLPSRVLSRADLSKLTPRQQARAIAAGLARSWSRHRHLLPVLTEALDRIQPPSARLVVLDELRRCQRADPGDIRRLRKALDMTALPNGQLEDVRLQQGLLAELDRLSGNHGKARRGLNDSVADLPQLPAASLARWRWVQARSRLRMPVSKKPVNELITASPRYPLLQAACLHVLAAAEPHPEKSSKLLDQAMSRCRRVDRPTRWAAEIFRAAGQHTKDRSLLATAADLERQLGRPAQRAATGRPTRIRPPHLPVQILADRPGERSANLPGPDWAPPDLALQRRLVVEWPDLAHEMGQALFGGLPGPRDGPGLTGLRLESDEVAGQALPWELAIPPGPAATSLGTRWPETSYRSLPAAAARLDIRWLQRALVSLGLDLPVDGVLGPITMDILNAHFPDSLPVNPAVRRDLGKRLAGPASQPPVTVLLRPEAAVELAVSSHWDSGFDVTDLYARFGFAVRTASSIAEIPPPTEQDPIAILHVTGRMDIRGAAPYVDFSPAEMSARMGFKARGTDVWPKDIARWLRGCRPGQEPLVVLDPPYPGSPYDVPWQLVLRNMFTATLFAEASAPVIIATGVRASGASYIMPIADGVRSGTPLATIAAQLRQADGTAADRPPELATADWGIADDARAALATAVFAAPSAFTLAAQ